MTTLRIAHAEPRPGRLADGGFQTRGHLVVLADDAGHRAVSIWIQGAGDLADLLERAADQVITAAVPEELTTRLLGAARARVTGVDIDVTEADTGELSPEVTVARIGLAGPAGPRQVTADLGLGLALAAAAGAPVRLADAVLDRLAVPVPGDDLLTPFLDRVPPAAWPRPGHAPPGRPTGHAARAAALRAAQPGLRRRPGPVGPGLLARPRPGPAGRGGRRAGLRSRRRGPVRGPVLRRPAARRVRRPGPGHLRRRLPRRHRHLQRRDQRRPPRRAGRAAPGDPPALVAEGRAREDHGLTIAGHHRDWTWYEITARIPADADLIRFGISADRPGPDRAAEPGPAHRRAERLERRERGRLRRRTGPAGPRR